MDCCVVYQEKYFYARSVYIYYRSEMAGCTALHIAALFVGWAVFILLNYVVYVILFCSDSNTSKFDSWRN
jgi:hypothetical protein